MTETFKFQAEINQLLGLIINAFYSNKDIFLRELLSNASDAIDKIRHESLSNSSALEDESKFFINIIPDKEAGTLKIVDSGVGMTKADLVEKLGTIAKSGTKEFMQKLKDNKDNLQSTENINMIGQFGVGFYSSYLVADQVVVRTKNNNDSQYAWESDAGGTFTISKEETTLTRGTEITLYLKKEFLNYLEENTIRKLVKTHSEFINYPISLYVEKEVEVEEELSVDEPVEETNKDEPDLEKDDTSKKEEKQKKKVHEFEVLNKTKPLWTRDPKEITKEEYGSFYKSLSNDWEEHLAVKHVKVEGALEFTLMLFTPKHKPFDMFQQNKKQDNIKLYVKRVFITDKCEDFVPEYLSFVKGIIDSEDLPLNVSREFLQDNRRIVQVMRKHFIKKCLEMFNEIAKDKEDYKKFYEAFSKNIKLGIYEDSQNREKLADLLRFNTTTSTDMVSLKDYVGTMPEEQKDIYFLAGDNLETLKNSPLLEQCNRKKFEVLLLTDTIDEYAIQQLAEYDGKKLVSLAKDGVDLGKSDEEKKKEEEDKKSYDDVCKKMKEVLGDKVEKVIISHRLNESPCCLVSSVHGMTSNMQKILKRQALGNDQMSEFMMGTKIMEINPDNGIVKKMKERLVEENRPIDDLTLLLYQTALVDSGYDIEDPKSYTRRIYDMIKMGLSIEDSPQKEEKIEELVTPGVKNDMESVDN